MGGLEPYFRNVKLAVDPETYSVLLFEDQAQPNLPGYFLHHRAAGDHTIVAPLSVVRQAGALPGLKGRDDGWRLITIGAEVPLSTAGFFRRFADALADAGISILPLAGYRFDYVMVHDVNVERALKVMQAAIDAEARPAAPRPR